MVKYVIFPIVSRVLALLRILIISLRGKKDEIHVILNDSIGDDIYGMAYIKAFKEFTHKRIVIHCLKSRVFLINGYKGAFDYYYEYEKRSIPWRSIQYISLYKGLIKIARLFKIYSVSPAFFVNLAGEDDRDCLTLIRDEMLRIPVDSECCLPDFSDIECSDASNGFVFSNNGIILNTESRSINNDNSEFFAYVAKVLNEKGYDLYTNVLGNQKPIPGTKALNCGLEDFIRFASKAKAIVSVRTGLLDLVVNSKCPKFVVYFSLIMKERNDKTFFDRYTFKAWNVNNVKEYIFTDYNKAIGEFESFMNDCQL